MRRDDKPTAAQRKRFASRTAGEPRCLAVDRYGVRCALKPAHRGSHEAWRWPLLRSGRVVGELVAQWREVPEW